MASQLSSPKKIIKKPETQIKQKQEPCGKGICCWVSRWISFSFSFPQCGRIISLWPRRFLKSSTPLVILAQIFPNEAGQTESEFSGLVVKAKKESGADSLFPFFAHPDFPTNCHPLPATKGYLQFSLYLKLIPKNKNLSQITSRQTL